MINCYVSYYNAGLSAEQFIVGVTLDLTPSSHSEENLVTVLQIYMQNGLYVLFVAAFNGSIYLGKYDCLLDELYLEGAKIPRRKAKCFQQIDAATQREFEFNHHVMVPV